MPMRIFSIPDLEPAMNPESEGHVSPRHCLLASLVDQRGFTWACAGVTAALVGLNAVGVSLWKCPFHEVTGFPCPGCGMTRSCVCLIKGQFRQSLEFHAFGPVFMGIGVVALVGTLLPAAPRQRFVGFLQKWDRRWKVSWALFLALLIYSLTRCLFLG